MNKLHYFNNKMPLNDRLLYNTFFIKDYSGKNFRKPNKQHVIFKAGKIIIMLMYLSK